MSEMSGGSLFTDVADLAIPFGLLLSIKGVDYLSKKRKDMAKKKKSIHAHTGGNGCAATAPATAPATASATAHTGGDAGSCFLCMQQGGMAKARLRSEIMQITSDLKALLSDY